MKFVINMIIAIICAATAVCAMAEEDAVTPAPSQPNAAAEAVIKKILSQRLELSNLDSSAASRFSLSVTFSEIKGNRIEPLFDAVVERDGASVAYLFRYGNGLPYLFAGNGIAVWHDPKHPGELRMLKGVYPALSLKFEKGPLSFEMGVIPDQRRAQVLVDFTPMISDRETLLRSEYDPMRNRLIIDRSNGSMTVPLRRDADQDQFPLRELKFTDLDGKILHVEDITTGPAAGSKLFQLNEESFRQASLKINTVTAGEADTKDKFPLTGIPDHDEDILKEFGSLLQHH